MAGKRGNPNWRKGTSGNPGGRPKVTADVRALAQEHTTEAVGALVEIVSDREAPPAARVAAANALLDRGYGRAPQTVDVNVRSVSDFLESLSLGDAAPASAALQDGPGRVRH